MVVHVDGHTKKQNGITCDLCNSTHVDKFEYYSAKFDLVEVDRLIGKTGIKKIDRRWLDLDICIKCMKELIERVQVRALDRNSKETPKQDQVSKQSEDNWTAKS
jgi:hypothetical protein